MPAWEQAFPALRLGSLKNTKSPGCKAPTLQTLAPVPLSHWPLAVWGSFAPLAAAAGYGAALWYACRQLGGMSGDVSGFALTLGELCGLAVLTLVR